jgi:hypothetical protein
MTRPDVIIPIFPGKMRKQLNHPLVCHRAEFIFLLACDRAMRLAHR